jgi:hypothetical protein
MPGPSSAPIPKLYKYRSLQGDAQANTVSLLRDDTVYYALPSQFNDPYECNFGWKRGSVADQAKLYAAFLRRFGLADTEWDARIRAYKELHGSTSAERAEVDELMRKTAREIVDLVGVFCLSEVNNDILMWSHYADCHKGVCIEFSMPLGSAPEEVMSQVNYRDEFPTLDLYEREKLEIVRPCFLTKARHWHYEKEWRAIRTAGAGTEKVPRKAITGVILGCKISMAHEKLVRELAANHHPPLNIYRTRQLPDRYALEVVPA